MIQPLEHLHHASSNQIAEKELKKASVGETNLQDFLFIWLASINQNIGAKTWLQYKRTLEIHVLPRLGSKKLGELHPLQIQNLYNELQAEGVGARTIQLTHAILRNGLNKAYQWGLIATNPLLAVDRPKVAHVEMKTFSQQEAITFLRVTNGHSYSQLFRLALVCGIRLGELLGLMWKDVDWGNSALHIKRQQQRVPGKGVILVSPKTKRSLRTIQIGSTTLMSLKNYLEIKQRISTTDSTGIDLLFTAGDGNHALRRQIQREFKKILLQNNLPEIRFHDLRHTAASLMLGIGCPSCRYRDNLATRRRARHLIFMVT